MIVPQSNRAYCPKLYDVQYEKGRLAKQLGHKREPKINNGEFCFGYSYEGGAWLDGYDGTDPDYKGENNGKGTVQD